MSTFSSHMQLGNCQKQGKEVVVSICLHAETVTDDLKVHLHRTRSSIYLPACRDCDGTRSSIFCLHAEETVNDDLKVHLHGTRSSIFCLHAEETVKSACM
eukprot:TRINITY_DN39877_c0_g1_i1.p1 TRINITY_DN39877_c0_g1~~TRINITY_DN39877_c0_g1_i1.p1  ORF type:complete len:100 (-),score=9.26 TRINITY_DN39877_c0_g1_i1:201-500(-)